MYEILSLNNVTKSFKGFKLKNISFRLEPGYIMGLVGPNGSGKTTTIKLIMNMLRMNSGKIAIAGLDSAADEVAAKEIIGYVSDENIFSEEWKVNDVLKVLAMYYKTFDEQKFRDLIKNFELPNDRKIKDFSKGMKTKLMLAAALSRDTKLLLLDEPTSGLDPVVRTELLDILQEYIVGGGRSVLFSTHITTDLEKIADYITFISRGILVFTDEKDTVLERYRLVKGGPDELDGIKSALIGCRKTSVGFEGLATVDAAQSLPAEIVTERASLDDIVIFHTLGVRK